MHLGKSVVRAGKNVWSYSGVEAKVRDATSNDSAGPSVLQMSEIAQLSFNRQDCVEIVTMLDKRLNDKGKNWRHVWKSLTLLDYLAHSGNFAVVRYFRNNIHMIKTLKEFQHVDENGTDVGRNVREQAANLSLLLLDVDRLRRERGNGGKSILDTCSLSRHLADPHALPSSSSRPRSVSQPLPTSSDNARKLRQAAREKEAKELGLAMQASKEDEAKRLGLLREQAGETLFGEFERLQERSNSAPLVELAPDTGPPPPDPMQQLYEARLRQNAMLQAQQQEQQQAAFIAFQQQQQAEANYLAALQQNQQQLLDAMAQQAAYEHFQAQQAAYEQFQAQQQAEYVAQMQAQQAFQQPQFSSAFSPSPLPPPPLSTPGAHNPFASFALTSSIWPPPASYPSPSLSLSHPSALSDPLTRPRAATTSALSPRSDEKHPQFAHMIANGGGGVDTFGNVGEMRMGRGRGG